MRILFAGTPDFAVPSLKALAAAGHDIPAVLTQPDRPAGRGRRTVAGPVKDCARTLGIEVLQPESLISPSILADIQRLGPRVMVVVAYGLLLKREVLDIPEHGCINVHASLLPRWRGAAPIQRAIEAGDRETGISIMQMDEGLDTGPVLARRATPISSRDTAGSLHDRLAVIGAELLVETLKEIERGTTGAVPQDRSLATYARKITSDDARVDWRRPAGHIERQIRAMDPWPVARTVHGGRTIRLWQADVVRDGRAAAGEVVRSEPDGIDIACGEGVLRVKVLQREGGKRMGVAEFLNGYRIDAGEQFHF
jgi:methionyl-tRNA formyltransferase